jgi:DNA-binding transcriptional regulator YdaS (Cro superfamily)
MSFKHFFFAMSQADRAVFAESVGTSVGHLNNFCYGLTTLAPIVCTAIERESAKQITRRDLRPADCEAIWPDLLPA